MNILYIVQQSIYNNEGKWTEADSNIRIMSMVISQLIKKTDWNFWVLIAPLKDFCDLGSYNDLWFEGFPKDRVKFIQYPFVVNAFLNRQNFCVEAFMNYVFGVAKFDIIWNNIIELTRNIKTLYWNYKIRPRIISCNYWMDCPIIDESKVPEEISYDWRQFDGAYASDLIPFTSNETKSAFFRNAAGKFNIKFLDQIFEKSTVWDFGFSTTELDYYKIKTDEKLCKKVILFPNRLSGINYTHHLEFIQAIKNLSEMRDDFYVVFTNPSQKISWDKLRRDVPNLLVVGEETLNRKEYIELLWGSDIVVSLYTIERYGGCANTEAIYCDCIPVMTRFGEYIRRVSLDYPLFVEKDFGNLVEILNTALDSSPNNTGILKDTLISESSIESVWKKVKKDVDKMLGVEDAN